MPHCNERTFYLDYAATTPVDAEAIAAALPYYGSAFHNPASSHMQGQIASYAVEAARKKCEKAINAQNGSVYFTSGGTEAINQAIKCVTLPPNSRIVVSGIEHEAVLLSAKRMEKRGYIIDTVMPDENGVVTPEALRKTMRKDTALVCVMTVNNIIGTIQPIKELAAVAHEYNALFFTDAVQAVNSLRLDVADTNVDMLCVSGHKFYAQKGAGFLYVKPGVEIEPLLDGGSQEKGLRAGTVDVPAVVALGEAITRAAANTDEYNKNAGDVKNAFLAALEYGVEVAKDAHKTNDILCVAFDGISAGRLAVALSVAGVYCSVGSACSAGSATPPETLVNMGYKNAGSAIRFSFGKHTTPKAAISAAEIVNETVKKLLAVCN